MGISTFKGGVHPYDGKDLAKDQPIRRIKPKEILVYPLSQHIGAPASPIVAVGDTVLRGQKIAEAGGFVSAPVFASVSGTVKAIEPRHVATGDLVNSIIIENDGEMKETDFHGVEDVASLSKEQIIEKWRNFKGLPQELELPSAPKQFIQYLSEDDRPQVKADVNYENGMGVSIGRLREDTMFDYKFIGLSHNTVRGAAGGAVLCAEALTAKGYIAAK